MASVKKAESAGKSIEKTLISTVALIQPINGTYEEKIQNIWHQIQNHVCSLFDNTVGGENKKGLKQVRRIL